MTEELKQQIIAGAFHYAEVNGFSNNEVAKKSGINESYISQMSRNLLYTGAKDKPTYIADKWFLKLADWAGISVRKEYWTTVETPQMVEMIHWLSEAKENHKTITIINETGFGKTYTVNKFEKAHPQHTYKIVVSREHRLRDIVLGLISKMAVNIAPSYGTAQRIGGIAEKMRSVKRAGYNPLIIIDEAENLGLPALQMIKALYDAVDGYAGIVLIGTPQLLRTLTRMKERDRPGMPQLYRRLKVGIRSISQVPEFDAFFDKYKVERPLQKLLNVMCDNYGELHDYLEPVLREADNRKKAITEDFFRTVHNLPKLK